MLTALVGGTWVDITEEVQGQKRTIRQGLRDHGIGYDVLAARAGCTTGHLRARLSAGHDWPIPANIHNAAHELGLI